jgi:hypothetical protein
MNVCLSNYLILIRANRATGSQDGIPSLDEMSVMLGPYISGDPILEDLATRLAELIHRHFEQAAAGAKTAPFYPNVDDAFQDIASSFVQSEIQTELDGIQEEMGEILRSVEDPHVIENNAGLLLEISSLPQSPGEYSRAGLLAVAVGHLEQHLSLLESISKGEPSQILAGETRVTSLVKGASRRYGSQFDPSGAFTKEAIYAIEVRNSLIHREGRIDRRFLKQVGEDSIPQDAHGGLFEVSVATVWQYLDALVGFSVRASLFAWHISSDDYQFAKAGLNVARNLFEAHSGGIAQRYLSALPQEFAE